MNDTHRDTCNNDAAIFGRRACYDRLLPIEDVAHNPCDALEPPPAWLPHMVRECAARATSLDRIRLAIEDGTYVAPNKETSSSTSLQQTCAHAPHTLPAYGWST